MSKPRLEIQTLKMVPNSSTLSNEWLRQKLRSQLQGLSKKMSLTNNRNPKINHDQRQFRDIRYLLLYFYYCYFLLTLSGFMMLAMVLLRLPMQTSLLPADAKQHETLPSLQDATNDKNNSFDSKKIILPFFGKLTGSDARNICALFFTT